jgi:branched-chain amino acid transport system permease protein
VTEFFQLMFSGIALGCTYALVALGFVIIIRATDVINFAHGALVMLGAYITYQFANLWSIPFIVAVGLAMVCTVLVAVTAERLLLRRMVGQPVFTLVILTLGLFYVIEAVIPTIWGPEVQNLGDPWGVDSVDVGGVALAVNDLWALGITAATLVACYVFFRYSRYGLGMRATALDQEAALAQGVSVRRVSAMAWGISGVLAVVAGITLASGASGLSPGLSNIALLAFPAIILGGLDSPLGAVVGGVVMGIVQVLTDGYQKDVLPDLPIGLGLIAPYVVMIVVLMVRPYGLFGTRQVDRV